MIVVVIIGLLASMAIAGFEKVQRSQQNAQFINDVRVFSGACATYALEEGAYPPDSGSGTLSSELEGYINRAQFEGGTPIGGVYDVEWNSYGILCAVGVDGFTIDDAQIQEIDERYDDGNTATGKLQLIVSDRYYWVVE